MRHDTHDACDRYMKPDEAAEILRMSSDTILRKARAGLFEYIRVGSGPRAHYRIDRESFEAFLGSPPPLLRTHTVDTEDARHESKTRQSAVRVKKRGLD